MTYQKRRLLFFSVFVVAMCGIVYELLAGALSTYLLGNSILQFSLVVGVFLASMGLGSFLSRGITRRLLQKFLAIEILVGLFGGFSSLILFGAFSVLENYQPFLWLLTIVLGTLVGLEIPLLIRILRGDDQDSSESLKDTLGNVLSLDYLGALAASLLFPLVFVPRLGLIRTGLFFGLFNVAVGMAGIIIFGKQIRTRVALLCWGSFASVALIAAFMSAARITSFYEDILYDDEIILAKSTPYQRIVLTRWKDDVRLFIDGNLQFSAKDEYRYHEALVHPVMGLRGATQRVLVLGGGDGLATREILKYPTVESVTVVDLDPEMTRLFTRNTWLRRLNQDAFHDRRVTVKNTDAQKFLEQDPGYYDIVILDLPDPNHESLGKLYEVSFYRLVAKHLAKGGVLVTQATSPYYARSAFWCIERTLAGTTLFSGGPKLTTLPYHVYVPSFGEWGFVMASFSPMKAEQISIPTGLRFLSQNNVRTLFAFPEDLGPVAGPINRLDNQVLVQLYEQGYRQYNH